jgi:hypothetical protein
MRLVHQFLDQVHVYSLVSVNIAPCFTALASRLSK